MALFTFSRLKITMFHSVLLLTRATFVTLSLILLSGLALKFLFNIFPWSVCYMLYLNHVSWPPKYFIEFSNLSFHDLEGDNFYITANGVTLGVWRIPPVDPVQDDLPVILYVHGNAGTRATFSRVELYKNMRKLGFTIVSFDYRGYGDSSGTPWGENDLVLDGFAVYEWIRREYPEKEIFIWGHSLGTGVSTHLVQFIEKKSLKVDGLILDSPFSDLNDAMRKHPLLSPLHLVPGFTDEVASAMRRMQVNLNNSAAVLTIQVPLLILHSEDDRVVPIELGKKLYQIARQRSEPVQLVTFRAELGYGHKGIYRDPELPKIVNEFFDVCRNHHKIAFAWKKMYYKLRNVSIKGKYLDCLLDFFWILF